jgi:hypothetical protein
MRVRLPLPPNFSILMLTAHRIVEYATRDQAQTAVNTLSNQNLMGRLVYVREVGPERQETPRHLLMWGSMYQDREAEPRFNGQPNARAPYGGPPPGAGYGGGYGGAPAMAMGGGMGGGVGGRQIYVSNVCCADWDWQEDKADAATAPLHRRMAGPEGPFPSGW